jgi:prepilin-type N-terminal cleavage/methylation domain-containing protein
MQFELTQHSLNQPTHPRSGIVAADVRKRISVPNLVPPPCVGGYTGPRRSGLAVHAFTLIELLVVIGIIGILAALLLPAFGRAKSKSRNIVCVSQLRQLGMATRMYTDENNNLLPTAEILPSMPVDAANPRPRICDVLAPYVARNPTATNAGAAVFKCPSDEVGRFASEGSSYEWNTDLNGHRMDETTTGNMRFVVVWVDNNGGGGQTNGTVQLKFPPTTTPLLLDYEDFHARLPKSGKNVVFMDDHVAPLEVIKLE